MKSGLSNVVSLSNTNDKGTFYLSKARPNLPKLSKSVIIRPIRKLLHHKIHRSPHAKALKSRKGRWGEWKTTFEDFCNFPENLPEIEFNGVVRTFVPSRAS